MKLSSPQKQKLYLTRAALWSHIYRLNYDGYKNIDTVTETTKKDCANFAADAAVAEFDKRFNDKPEPKTEETKTK